MKKSVFMIGLLFFAFQAMNAMAAFPGKEYAAAGGNGETMLSSEHMRPFNAAICYSYNSYWSSGIGISTHLGLMSTESSFTDLYDGSGNIIGTKGHDVFTAADGSELIMDWTAALNEDWTEDGNWVFAGGTGRFADASGSGSLHAYFTADFDIVLFMTGTISY